MKQSVLVIAMLALSYLVYAHEDINYNHKAIHKALEKSLSLSNPQLNELSIPADCLAGINGRFFSVTCDKPDIETKYMYIGRVNSCRAGGCSMPDALSNTGPSEYFDYLVVFNSNSEVLMVKIFNYQASHGHEVTAKGWLKQFIGFHGDSKELEVGKNIDSISGATISAHGITRDINEKTQIISDLLQKS